MPFLHKFLLGVRILWVSTVHNKMRSKNIKYMKSDVFIQFVLGKHVLSDRSSGKLPYVGHIWVVT